MKRDTKKIGTVSELMVTAALVSNGYRLLLPYGDNARYDVVIEGFDGGFSRVQVKTGRLEHGMIEFNGYSSHSHRGGVSTRVYRGEIDFFGVYCPQVNSCYLVPASEVNTHGCLRIDPPRNGQTKGIRWADSYRLDLRATELRVGTSAEHVVRLGA
ncbi:MAG: group I intron-associated PD-(D/E)XK endonuclease [Candidatus Aquilonibacter sp.]